MTAQLEGSISSILAWLLTHCLKDVMLFTRKKERKEKSGSQTVKTITSYYLLGSSSSFAYASQIKTWTLSSVHLELSQIDWRSRYPIIQCVRNFIYSGSCDGLGFFVVMELMAMITQVLNEKGWSVETSLVHVCVLPIILSSCCVALNWLCLPLCCSRFWFFFLFWMCYAGFDYVKEESN